MKKLFALLFAGLLLISLVSCKKPEKETKTEPNEPAATEEGVSQILTGVDLEDGYETPVIFRN